jgi:LDH2 family malate/lactate/ureidoglycolate dehydrogenase
MDGKPQIRAVSAFAGPIQSPACRPGVPVQETSATILSSWQVPAKEGHVVLDMAMSQYSYGKLQVTRLKHQKLPYPGGFNANGDLTDDPEAIEETRRLLPMGYWKGSGFAILLDIISSLLSGGLSYSGVD